MSRINFILRTSIFPAWSTPRTLKTAVIPGQIRFVKDRGQARKFYASALLRKEAEGREGLSVTEVSPERDVPHR